MEAYFKLMEQKKQASTPQVHRATFEKNTLGVGSKIMAKLGWNGGGLGKNGDGITVPIAVIKRDERAGLGANGGKEASQLEQNKRVMKQYQSKGAEQEKVESSDSDYFSDDDNWKKDKQSSAPPKRYILQKHPKVTFALNEQDSSQTTKFVDMTNGFFGDLGSNKYSPEKIMKMKESERPVAYELNYNINKLYEQALFSHQKATKTYHDSERLLTQREKEMEQLKVDLETSAMAYQEIEGLSQAIIQFKAEMDQYFQQIEQKSIANRYLPSSEIYAYMNKHDESIINSYRLFHFFEELQLKYFRQYENQQIDFYFPCFYQRILQYELYHWDPIQNPEVLDSIKTSLMDVMMYDLNGDSVLFCQYIQKLISTIVLPKINSSISQWNVLNPSPLLQLFSSLSSLISKSSFEDLTHHSLYTRLEQAIEAWKPSTCSIPLAEWILPWEVYLHDLLPELYVQIQQTITSMVHQWQPFDHSLFTLLVPFKDYWKKENMNRFLIRNIIPKLRTYLSSLVIDPNNQDIDIFQNVIEWKDLLQQSHLGALLQAEFFPKFLSVLYTLVHTPSVSLNDLYLWLHTWLELFPQELFENQIILAQFGIAWDMINDQLDGKETRPLSSYVQTYRYEDIITNLIKQNKQTQILDANKTSFYDVQIRDVIEKFASSEGYEFRPIDRTFNNHKLYMFEKTSIFIDDNIVYKKKGENWFPTAIEDILS